MAQTPVSVGARSVATTGTRKTGPRKKGWRKDEIICAAAECFMEHGYQATTVDNVAARLGCTKGRIYHHYASKSDLFFDVHREGMQRLFRAQEPALATQGDGLAVLRAMCVAHGVAMLEHHTFENVVAQGVNVHRFNSASPEHKSTVQELIDSRDAFEGMFKKAIARAIADGSLRAVDVAVTAKVILGALQWTIFWYRPAKGDSAKTRAALAESMVDPLIEGLRKRT
ncbi:TetR/AcrR family transcriptional regulator [Pseudosulfitobacter koreensis]|uniref:TetR/AcrR family transcriptional regulator n=1 Tax=Pseudosulfitobacter koreensis TaxID=2968472 RepID=A0ABT1YY36_9RHOB|nr:TetR/AcrR family transcriptional regulator [Pseudosulfitobacter koreense]MCR8825795.1 TetR/AcrR family transcriptional regulator [Pseudosulfitobacter koreense]